MQPLVSHPSTRSKIAIGIHKAEAEVCLPRCLAGKLLGCECPGDFHCVTETDSGVKAGLLSVCDICFRSVGSGRLSQRRNVGGRKSNCSTQQIVLGSDLRDPFQIMTGEPVEDGHVGKTELSPCFLSLHCSPVQWVH